MGNSISLIKNLKRTRKYKNAKKFKTFDSESNNNDSYTCRSFISDSSTKAESKHSYILTDSFDESERIKRKHFVIKYIFEGNFSAPVQDLLTNGCRVLDIGCGPGTWILDTASEFTQSSFIGLDIFHMFPSEIKPNNADFIVADAQNNLPFESNYFDYIHLGDMGFCFSDYDFDHVVIPECVRILKPGGWIEFQESHRKMNNEGPCSVKFTTMAKKLLETMDIKSTHYSQNDLKKNSYITNINEDVKLIPLGSWGGKLGEEFEEAFIIALLSFAKPVANMYNCPAEEINELINNMRSEMSEYKSSYDFIRTFGQKKYSENNEIIMK
ncbi:hypothetical protein Glove_21g376 [Diversispora epigaea]|uniref:Methyltransferase domain-containing protein n=1 Tax=Diversispora epigaea TaxID=1348612 RepID=A0A397JUR2_9GLOM|nr:hypothetical protein Glove_21g376 [Diversispora epigaea]